MNQSVSNRLKHQNFDLRVVLGIAACGFFTGCEERVTRVEFDAVQREAAGAKAALEELEARSAGEISDLEEALGETSSKRDALESEVEVLKQELEDAKNDLEAIKTEYEDYRRKYRVSVRENAKDRQFERLVLSGDPEEVFTNVTVMELNPARVRVRHEAGVIALPLASLSPEIQTELAFDLEEATAFLEAEAEASRPKVLTKEEENQKIRDDLAKERMQDLAAWKKAYNEAQRVEKQIAAVAARQRAVVAALNRYYEANRRPTGSQLNNVNKLKQQRAQLDHLYETLKIKHRKLLNE